MILAGLEVSVALVVIGALTGLAYALLATGLVLVYRASGVINFAHGQIGAFCAALLAKVVIDYDWPWALALIVFVLLGGVIGGVIELGIIRRLFTAPRLIVLVSTIGISQILLFSEVQLVKIKSSEVYPSPLDREWRIGSILLLSPHFMLIAVAPAVIVGLMMFLNRTPHGIAIRAAAANADTARLRGINVKRVSTMVWVIAGLLSALTAILINPVRGTVPGLATAALGPTLLLRALTAALVGRMVSLPWTLVGGVVVGIVEAIVFASYGSGTVDLVLLVAVLCLVLVTRPTESESTLSIGAQIRPLSRQLRQLPTVRRLRRWAIGGSLAAAVLLPIVFSNASQVFLFSRVVIYAMIALSITVLTGWAGQLSLGQFAFVGLGAFCTAALVDRGVPFAVAVIWAVVAGVLVGLAVGIPALRVRGLFLAVTTLAFAVACASWVFKLEVFTGESTGVIVPRPELGPIDFAPQRTYYYLCLAVLVAVGAAIAHLRTTGAGRVLIAVRENEENASAYTVAPARAKLAAFALAGGIAALAGGLFAGLVPGFGADRFGTEVSLEVAAMAIIGGVGSVAGSILGAVWVVGLPALFPDVAGVSVLTSGAGLLVLLLYLPGGFASAVFRIRDIVVAAQVRRSADSVDADSPVDDAAPPAAAPVWAGPQDAATYDGPALAIGDVTVAFGGRRALDQVNLHAEGGELVGLIGSNGAGKSTLMNVISGFLPHEGTVEILGEDVSALPAHRRGVMGLGRTFQAAKLFGDMTVAETLQVARERVEPSELVPSLLRLPPSVLSERRKRADADEIIDFLGLGHFRDTFVRELSTGTRRVVELAGLLSLHARVLLLDEPTAGVAQREVEAFGPLIERIQTELGATLILIEHDLPLVMALSDRVYCLEAGRVIAEGGPETVRNDPLVIASYLGSDERAITRSEVTVGVEP